MAAAAYRAGGLIVDQRTGLVHDYSRRRAEIEGWVAAPEGAPEWATDRAQLWNQVEATETRKNSRTAHELEVALPSELTPDEQRGLVESFVAEHVTSRGVVADVNIHRDKRENPHAHILMTTRTVGEDGWGEKDRDLDRKHTLYQWREAWGRETNRELERAGHDERIDHRSHADRGIDKEPTRHEGPAAREMESRGVHSDRAEQNRQVSERNHRRERLEREAHRRGVSPEELEARLKQRRREQQRSRKPAPEPERRDDRDHEPDRDL